MAVAGFAVTGRPFAVWPATLQVMPEGVLDGGFRRFFVGVRVTNTSAQAWPSTEVRISVRGRRILAAAGIAVSDGWSSGDAAAMAQTAPSEWIPVPALAPGAFQTVFFKMDVSSATPGLHTLELEIRDPTAPSTTLKTSAPLPVARTACLGSQHTFTSTCDEGTLTAAISNVSIDQELFRRVLSRARALDAAATPGMRTRADTERLRSRLRGLLCGEETDVCSVLGDLNTTCALPLVPPPGPVAATGAAAIAVLADQLANIEDRVKIVDGAVYSNHDVTIGDNAVINGNVTAGDDVVIDSGVHIQGDVTAADNIQISPFGGVVISGTKTQHASFTPIPIPTKTVSPGGSNVTVNIGQGTLASPIVINPGNYNSITINSNSVVALSAGVYNANAFVIFPNVTLILNQTATTAIDVRVQQNLSFGDNLVVKPGTSPPGLVAQFYSNQITEVLVGKDINPFPIALTVPQGSIHVYFRTNVTGSLAAKTITLEQDSTVTRVPTDDWLGSGGSGLEFLGYATGVAYAVAYNGTFFGNTGPLAFNQVSWKALLASAILQYDLALPGAVSAELVSTADQAVVATLKAAVLNAPATAPGTTPPSTQAGSVDAAVATVRGNRSLGAPLFAFQDASPGEINPTPVSSPGGLINTPGTFLTNAQIDTIIANAATAPANLKVYKSGAGSGVTRGIISALLPVVARDDETGTLQFINQLLIVADPASPPAGGRVASSGDSGALWIQTSTNKVVGMTHTVGSSGAVVTRFEDVVNALQFQLA